MSENKDEFVVQRAGVGEMKPRYRSSAKQTAKGGFQLEATVEVYDAPEIAMSNPQDAADVKRKSIGRQLADIIKDTATELRKDGHKLVSDTD